MYKNNYEWRADFQAALASIQPTHMATMNYSKPLAGSHEQRYKIIVTHLREWNRAVLTALFGRKFAKHNQDDAFLFVGFVERGALLEKEHMHLLIRVPDHLTERFESTSTASSLWKPKAVMPGVDGKRNLLRSDIVIRPVYEAGGAIRYCTKSFNEDTERMVWSSDFR